MKILFLLRHAKSSWNSPGLDDHERPLNKRGQRDAPKMAEFISRSGFTPDFILSSTALRAESITHELIKSNPELKVSFTKELYLAAPKEILDLISLADHDPKDEIEKLMIVGHNPGLEELVYLLTGENEFFPTAALAVIELDISSWGRNKTQTGL